MEGEGESDGALSYTNGMIFSSAPHWLEFVPAEGLAVCEYVCSTFRIAAQEDRLWKEACHRRWTRVNAGTGGYRRSFASLNGWRTPRFRRTILTTTAPSRTRSSQAAAGGSHARNISAMDVGPSKVVVCSADTAWFYKVSTSASSSSSSSSSSTLGGRQHHRRRQYYHQQQQPDGEQQQVRQSSSADTVGNDQESDDDDEKEEKEEKKGSVPSDAHVEPQAPWGCRVLGWNVTEARFSADERRCYFGTVSGLIYSHEVGDAPRGRRDSSSSRPHRRPIVSNFLTTASGSPVAVRQIVQNVEGGSAAGAKLGVLCRPPSGWQPNLDGVDAGGYLILVDTEAQATARTMRLSDGTLGGEKFPSMTCGGAAVSLAAVGSSGSTSGMPLAAGGEAFAVGYGGGAVTLLDGRCRERGGMVGGFVTSHRWLERVRCAGYLLMTSYGRFKFIETWDLRKLPSRGECPYANTGRVVSRSRPPPRTADLTCAGHAPDFWVAPHGLTVAVYGAPRKSQSFGARHSFWSWPTAKDRLLFVPQTDPLNFSRGAERMGRRGGGDGGGSAGSAEIRGDDVSVAFSEGIDGVSHALQAFASAGGGVSRRAGVELSVPGVVNDSDYRLKLSTGIKFCDTHMATVLDESRVLVDEVMGSETSGGARGEEGVRSVHLSAQCVDVLG